MKPERKKKNLAGTPWERWHVAVLNIETGRRVLAMARLLDKLCADDVSMIVDWADSLPADEPPTASMNNPDDHSEFLADVREFGWSFAADARMDEKEAAKHLSRLLSDPQELRGLCGPETSADNGRDTVRGNGSSGKRKPGRHLPE